MITFDRIVCINLDRRPDRWQGIQQQLADAGWPFGSVERFSAVDGRTVPPPRWWRAGAGAWGCHQSHVAVMQRAVQDGITSLLVLEDDAVLAEGFAHRAQEFLAAVPHDWDGLMLGGQHLNPPEMLSCGIVRVLNGNRTHAYALRSKYLIAAYQHLCDYPDHAKRPRFHVDHRLGMLHKQFRIYAPDTWLIGQGQSVSDIAEVQRGERFWSLEPGKAVAR